MLRTSMPRMAVRQKDKMFALQAKRAKLGMTDPGALCDTVVSHSTKAQNYSLSDRKAILASGQYAFSRPPHYSTFYDFDAWVYSLQWSQMPAVLPMMGKLSVVADDIKFASNAWSMLRVCAFYGLPHPRVLSELKNTTPSMTPHIRGNWKFYEHCTVGSALNPKAAKVALMPSHPKAVSLADCDWEHLRRNVSRDGTVEIVLGMENGMREDVVQQCDAWLSIPQYGSCGSLSMLNALGIVMHSANSVLHPRAAQRRLFIGSSESKKVRHGLRPPAAVTSRDSKLSEALLTNPPSTTPPCSSSPATLPPPPPKKTYAGIHSSSAASIDPTIDWVPSCPKDFTESRPHVDDLLGLSDEAIGQLLAERRKRLPLQLGTYHYNESGDRNIGAIVRNGNIYNFEKMIIVGRRKFNRRGTVGTHHYTNICYHDTFESADADCEGYAVWLLHCPYPYLCNRIDEILPEWTLTKEPSVGRKAAKNLPSAYMFHGDPVLQAWLKADQQLPLVDFAPAASCALSAADAEAWDAKRIARMKLLMAESSGLTNEPLVEEGSLTSWEREHPMYGVIAEGVEEAAKDIDPSPSTASIVTQGEKEEEEDSESHSFTQKQKYTRPPLLPTVHLDDELSIVEAVASVQRRGLRGIMLVVPEEGSTPVWPMLARCERLVTIAHPSRMCGSVQKGLTSAVSTAIALERLREATLMLKKNDAVAAGGDGR